MSTSLFALPLKEVSLIQMMTNPFLIPNSLFSPNFPDTNLVIRDAINRPALKIRYPSRIIKSLYLTKFDFSSKEYESATTGLNQKYAFDWFRISKEMLNVTT